MKEKSILALRRLLTATLVVAPLAAGCASETMRTSRPPGETEAVAGLPYYLPRLAVRVTITGTKPTPKAENGGGGTPPKQRARANPTPGGDGNGEAPANEKYKFTVTVGKPEYIADGSKQYFLEYLEEAFSDDEFSLKVGANGLLQSTDSKSTDRTGDVIRKFAELASQVAKFGVTTALPGRRAIAGPREKCNLPSFAIERLVPIHPSTPSTISVSLDSTTSVGNISVEVVESSKPAEYDLKTKEGTRDYLPKIERTYHHGVVFPVVQPVTANIVFNPNDAAKACNATTEQRSLYAMAPNGDIFRADVSRAALVTKHVALTVEDGVLTAIKVEKPSEALAFVSLPVDVLKTLVAIPGELLTLKVKHLQDEGSLTKAEAELLKQQVELMKAQQALEQARNAPQ